MIYNFPYFCTNYISRQNLEIINDSIMLKVFKANKEKKRGYESFININSEERIDIVKNNYY